MDGLLKRPNSTNILCAVLTAGVLAAIKEALYSGVVQKPDLMTTFSRSDGINNTNLNINDLTPASDGQDILAKGGQGHRLFNL